MLMQCPNNGRIAHLIGLYIFFDMVAALQGMESSMERSGVQ
jgi:hypothetical protein